MRADIITKDYISDTTVFADVFNYYIYGGEQVIKPEQLTERDPGEIALPYGADGAAVPIQKYRDVQKLCTVMTDGHLGMALYGVENQAEVHYAMPVKNNLYDALDYAGQVEEVARSHKNARKREKESCTTIDKDKKNLSSGEFLSGFWKEDRLIPSVTVTLYFGTEEWAGPMSLFEMMEADPKVLSCMDDYHVRLIAPAQMEDEEIMKFESSLREVLLFIKYSKDKKNLDKMMKKNEERFQDMERRAADVIEVITHAGLKFKEGEEKVNMCQAIREMREEERMKGEEYGRKIGEERGRKVGEEQQNELMRRLLQDDRLEDLRRAVNDRDYREQLFIEYKIKDR